MNKVGYVYDVGMMDHEHPFDKSHPECPNRIKAIYEHLVKENLIPNMIRVIPRYATIEELLLAHDPEYIAKLNKAMKYDNNFSINKYISTTYNSTYANIHTFNSAMMAAGSTLELIDSIINDEIGSGIAIVRPPGHHAAKRSASGFCFFNNVAISAIHARNKGLKVCIVDFDVHYGDGTADIVANENNILFISVHRYDGGHFYPGSGGPSKISNIKNYGLDTNRNGDEKYILLFKSYIIPHIKNFSPDLLVVSAGFDAGSGDPLGGYDVTPDGFAQITRRLKEVCPSIALVLEGGYNLTTISKSMAACTKILLEKIEN